MKIRILPFAALLCCTFTLSPLSALARGGGGGSGGGDGGGLGAIIILIWHLPFPYNILVTLAIVGALVGVWYQARRRRKLKIAAAEAKLQTATSGDAIWDEGSLKKHAVDTFTLFENAWANFDMKTLEAVLTPDYYKRIYLELTVLQNERRQNRMIDAQIVSVALFDVDDKVDNSKDNFQVEIVAAARDELIDTETGAILFRDTSKFTEYWRFWRTGNDWKLGEIRQATEQASSLVPAIAAFATEKGFYYDPDFGWLMMPNKGVLFSKSNFGTTDINNHVIGYYREKIVEFYTMTHYDRGHKNARDTHLIGQAILPIQYKNIFITRHSMWNFLKKPSGLKKHSLESNQFNKEFDVYAHPDDNIATFELLHPAYMEYIIGLPFKLSIEVVDNTLYFYTKDVKKANYPKLLEILSRAFDELKA